VPVLIGMALALAVGLFARFVGLDRDRAFYPVVLIIVGSYYVLFAVMAGRTGDLLPEIMFFALFATAAILGFKSSLWIVAAGLAAHGIFDFVRDAFIAGAGIPAWWPGFCGAYDLAAAVLLAAFLISRRDGAPAA